jgi:ectoine hydroxylase-related dioxygenase (phytanoyl-CoA dioxygenase family)
MIDRSAYEQAGFAIVPDVLTADDVGSLIVAHDALAAAQPSERQAGIRNLLRELPTVAATARSPAVARLVTALLGAGAFPVRALFFDKTPGANWKVPWHQDLAIAVCGRVDTAGFTGWSVKDGVPHVHPPAAILARMVTVRLHLDECGTENGPLRVLPGSHRHGRLDQEAITRWRSDVPETVCTVSRGGALVMSPLLLHASSAATHPAHRRVLHLEYAADPLPGLLRWANGPDGK